MQTFASLKSSLDENIHEQLKRQEDYKTSVELYKQASDTKLDDITAVELYKKSAALGHVKASVKLVELYKQEKGGLKHDLDKEHELLEQALKYADEFSDERDKSKKLMAELLLERNKSIEDVWMARYYYQEIIGKKGKENVTAVQAIKNIDALLSKQILKQSTSGDPKKRAEDFYKNGKDLEKNPHYPVGLFNIKLEIQARLYYQAAAELGHQAAKNDLAILYLKERGGLSYEPKLAYELLRQAAMPDGKLEAGNKNAIYNLAILYWKGEGVEQDLEKANQLFNYLASTYNDARAVAQIKIVDELIARNKADESLASQIKLLIPVRNIEFFRNSETMIIETNQENGDFIRKHFGNYLIPTDVNTLFKIRLTDESRKEIDQICKELLAQKEKPLSVVNETATENKSSTVEKRSSPHENKTDYNQRIKDIEKELAGWNIEADKEGKNLKVSKEANGKSMSFAVRKNIFVTSDTEIETFIAMLNGFKATHKDGKVPHIKTYECNRDNWVAALRTVCPHLKSDTHLERFINLKDKPENKEIPMQEQKPAL